MRRAIYDMRRVIYDKLEGHMRRVIYDKLDDELYMTNLRDS